MAFSTVQTGQDAEASHINQLVNALSGVSNEPIALTGVSSASAALSVSNAGAGKGITINSGGLLVTAGGAVITAGGATITAGGLVITAGGLLLSADGITVPHISTPSAPGASKFLVYAKSDDRLYFRSGAAGSETLLLPATGVGTSTQVLHGGTTPGFASITSSDFTTGTTAMVKISDTTLGADTNNFDFTSIPGSYKHLMLVMSLRGTKAALIDTINIVINNDTGATYYGQGIYAQASSVSGYEVVGATSCQFGWAAAASATTAREGTATIVFSNYAGTTLQKSWSGTFGAAFGTSTTNIIAGLSYGEYPSTSAITRITVSPGSNQWKAASHAALYGIPA